MVGSLDAIVALQTQIRKVVTTVGACHTAFLDVSKAFDRIDHTLLLYKLRYHMHVRGPLLLWIMNFLKNRIQKVRILGDENSSNWLNVESGTPQGTVLGMTLFNIYINDIPIDTGILFADDTTIYSTKCKELQCQHLNEVLNEIYEWSNKWKIDFNVKKCKHVIFGEGHGGLKLGKVKYPR